MSDHGLLAAYTIGVCLLVLVALFLYKAFTGLRRRFEGVRRAAYIAVIGELSARGAYPTGILSDWADDRVFRNSLQGFIALVDGIERTRLLRVAQDLGIIDDEVHRLKSPRRKVRARAAEALAAYGDPMTAEALTGAVEDRHSTVRVNALAGLARIGQPGLVDKVLLTIDEETEWEAARIIDQLVVLGAPAVGALVEYVGHPETTTRRYATVAIEALGAIGDLAAQATIIRSLDNPDLEIRASSAGALQSLASGEAVPALLDAVRDLEPVVRIRAAKALGESFDESAVGPLEHALSDPEWWVRKNSAESLSRLPGGIDGLQRAVRSSDEFARDAAREQLMILGIPAGQVGSQGPASTRRSIASRKEGSSEGDADWVAEQLDALNTLGGEDEPDEVSRGQDGPQPSKAS